MFGLKEETLLMLGIGYLVLKDSKPKNGAKPKNGNGVKRGGAKAAAPKPATKAFIYQLPVDSYDTVRMAFQLPGQAPREMGIFAKYDKALEVARSKGWRLQWNGVRHLEKAPS